MLIIGIDLFLLSYYKMEKLLNFVPNAVVPYLIRYPKMTIEKDMFATIVDLFTIIIQMQS